MKKQSVLTVIMIMAIYSVAQCQTVFSLRPGLNLNSASIGFRSKNLQPYFGLRFANLNVVSEYEDTSYPADNSKTETKIHVYMPCVGTKLYLKGTDAVKPYLMATMYKPFAFGKQLDDDTEDDSFKESLNNLKIWAAELGFGSEYFFHPQFSLGGEFGLRWANIKDKFESSTGTYSSSEKYGIGLSYVAVSINFYFTKGKEQQ
jgi:hypothetical protein